LNKTPGARRSKIRTKTKETEITVAVDIDGTGKSKVSTGIKFLDHMIAAFSTHSMFDIEISAQGDLKHHIIEDTALALGKCISDAMGDRNRIKRFSSAFVPMDESLAFASIDLVKRRFFVLTNFEIRRNSIEDLPKEDAAHFFSSLCDSIQCTIHLKIEYGSNDHHKIEALFKALALALRYAAEIDPRRETVASSKGSM
jgi:imidazoleglycerol-phosphate dehydratase